MERGAKLDAVNNVGETALFAAVRGSAQLTKLLIDLGASTDNKNTTGQTAAEVARSVGESMCAEAIEAVEREGHMSSVLGQQRLQIAEQQNIISEQAAKIEELMARVADLEQVKENTKLIRKATSHRQRHARINEADALSDVILNTLLPAVRSDPVCFSSEIFFLYRLFFCRRRLTAAGTSWLLSRLETRRRSEILARNWKPQP